VIEGRNKLVLLNGDWDNYDVSNGYTWHEIGTHKHGIVVKLGAVYLLNRIQMLLWDRDDRSYAYYVEVRTKRPGTWLVGLVYRSGFGEPAQLGARRGPNGHGVSQPADAHL